jgi:purine-nucleoside phosphorylase
MISRHTNLKELSVTHKFLEGKIQGFKPEAGVILGTGLSKLAHKIEVKYSISYEEIPHFPVSTVESHTGRLLFGELFGKQVVAMQGRFHYYEGYTLQQITFPVRVMHSLGVSKLFVSNAAGAVNLNFKKASLMLITDHINLLLDNPLIGPNVNEWGPRFPDMSAPYDADLNNHFRNVANELDITLHEGVYTAMSGPTLETRAEYRLLGKLGTDAVGMSTVPEVIVANHIGLPCAAVSVLTDECDPDNLVPVTLEEIIEIAGVAEGKLVNLLEGVFKKI